MSPANAFPLSYGCGTYSNSIMNFNKKKKRPKQTNDETNKKHIACRNRTEFAAISCIQLKPSIYKFRIINKNNKRDYCPGIPTLQLNPFQLLWGSFGYLVSLCYWSRMLFIQLSVIFKTDLSTLKQDWVMENIIELKLNNELRLFF